MVKSIEAWMRWILAGARLVMSSRQRTRRVGSGFRLKKCYAEAHKFCRVKGERST
jgi:hypothetical protein